MLNPFDTVEFAPQISHELESLRQASNLLQQAKRRLVDEPMPIFGVVHHAQKYIDAQIENLLREVL